MKPTNVEQSVVYKDSSVIDQQPASVRTYQPLFYLSVLKGWSQNDGFLNNYFDKVKGIQIGVPLFYNKGFTLRFNVGFIQSKFNADHILADNSEILDLSITSQTFEAVSFLPDIMIHPFQNWLISPYANLGVGALVGAKSFESTYKIVLENGTEKIIGINYPLGVRYVSQFGVGVIVHALPFLDFTAGASYNFEFMENRQTTDVFYNFKNLKDDKYKFVYGSFGIVLKLKRA